MRYVSGSFGLKSAKTFSSVASVVRSFMLSLYVPAQKKVFPSARSRPCDIDAAAAEDGLVFRR